MCSKGNLWKNFRNEIPTKSFDSFNIELFQLSQENVAGFFTILLKVVKILNGHFVWYVQPNTYNKEGNLHFVQVTQIESAG